MHDSHQAQFWFWILNSINYRYTTDKTHGPGKKTYDLFKVFYILLIWIVVQTCKVSNWFSLNRLEKPAVLLKKLLRELNQIVARFSVGLP